MQAKTPLHPTLDFQCQNCKFWHPDLIEDIVFINPNTPMMQMVSLQALRSQGQLAPPGSAMMKMSKCFYNPQWIQTAADSYCGHYESKPND